MLERKRVIYEEERKPHYIHARIHSFPVNLILFYSGCKYVANRQDNPRAG